LRRRKELWVWVALFVVAVLVGASFAIPLPYYLDGPGSVRATESRIAVEGVAAFDEDGVIAFTTVSQRQATPALLVKAWLDEVIDVSPREEVLGGRTAVEDRRINQQLMEDSKMVALVVAFQRVGLPAEVTGSGARIEQLAEGGAAQSVLREGEIITAIDGRAVEVAADVSVALGGRPAGTPVEVTVRDGDDATRERTATVVLGANEEDPNRGFLGVLITTADFAADLPADVELDSGQVIGPSAGLAWTLGVIDRLTPGRLDGGKRVVVTGTMDLDGRVGPIGGLPQKVAAAKEFGASLFLYPASSDPRDVRRMRDIAGDDLRVEPVDSIDDALGILAPDGLTPPPSMSAAAGG